MINLTKIAIRIAASTTNSCIYVDLDETLIHTFLVEDLQSLNVFKSYPGRKIFHSGMATLLRPGAIELLAELRALNSGPVYLLTHSNSEYANTMVRNFKFDVDAVFPRESLMGQVGNGEEKFVLIDDLGPPHPVFQLKAMAMGIPLPNSDETDENTLKTYYSTWHVQPPQFLGSPTDQGLSGIAEAVANLLTMSSLMTS